MRALLGFKWKKTVFYALLLMLAVSCSFLHPAWAEEDASQDKWTVMIYFCGSDLESLHGMATFNLQEMAEIHPVIPVEELMNSSYDTNLDVPDVYGDVNVVFETGGCREWHAKEEPGLDISAEKLQRWEFCPVPQESEESPFTLLEELPLRSMADPETLADFIRWGAKTYPAEKYALVLWDHGGGSATGIFLDELFENDIMYLDELDQALTDGGVFFETVILDACMMACIETAQALYSHAAYMVASEEVTSGYGSAFGYWLGELYVNPERNGRQFGVCFCDMMLQKYAELGEDQAYDLLTYSVLDLSYIDELSKAFNESFAGVDLLYTDYPEIMGYLGRVFSTAEVYGMGKAKMLDIGSILYNDDIDGLMNLELHSRYQNLLNDCVTYCVRGKARSDASGLSFCYAVNMEPQDLDIYARNCRNPYYLAYLDAISDWNAPDSLYEEAARLPEASETQMYRFETETVEYNGLPAVAVSLDQMAAMGRMQYYEWYSLDEDSGQYVRLGKDDCNLIFDEDIQKAVFFADAPEKWPMIDGILCSIEWVNSTSDIALYNIPIRMETDIFNFRCSYNNSSEMDMDMDMAGEENLYTIHGIWNGYDAHTGQPNRNVSKMSDYQGREYQLIYPVYTEDQEQGTYYVESDFLTMYRNILVEEETIPEGDYALRYVLTDIHGRELPQEMTYFHWDGVSFSVKDL